MFESILIGFSLVPPLIVARVLGERRCFRGYSGSFSNGDDLLSFDLWVSFILVPSSILGLPLPPLTLPW